MEIKTGITKEEFGRVDNEPVFLYTLTNAKGHQVKITNYGGIVTSWVTGDRHGGQSGIVIGFNDLDKYRHNSPYFGALIGRYCNRIAAGRFPLDGRIVELDRNDGENHLHGGRKGFDQAVWRPIVMAPSEASLVLKHTSRDGDEGYPGNLEVTVHYTFRDHDTLVIEYYAETDKATPVNLTNHCYFNLAGCESPVPVTDHYLYVNAAHYTSFDKDPLPTGGLFPVNNTPFDFRVEKKIGTHIHETGRLGYDQNFVLNHAPVGQQEAASLRDEQSGRKLQVYTTQPGMQLYTGNHLDGSFLTDSGHPVNYRTAVCLETQHFPDSPNRSSFPGTILRPGEKFYSKTSYSISVY